MGLKSDFDELISNWKGQPILLKVVYGIMFFITASSITSLSEVVFKWRGFIAEGLGFYKSNVVGPIKDAARSVGIELSRFEIDQINIVLLVIVVPMARSTWLRHKNGTLRPVHKTLLGYAIFQFVATLVLVAFNFSASDGPLWIAIVVGVVLLGMQGYFLRSIAPTALALLLVLVMAAINTGMKM